MKKGTSTAKIEKPTQETMVSMDGFKPSDKPHPLTKTSFPEQEPNEKLLNFIKDNNLNFKVGVYKKNYVYVDGEGFIFFDKPQLIYKAEVNNG